MMNNLGKSLVFVHVALSLLGLTWAAALFFLAPDWGFKQPRADLDQKIASELEKRVALVKDATQARDAVLPALKQSQVALYAAMDRFGQNHLYYRAELDRLRNSKDPIKVKEIKFQGGALVLETPRTGKPVQEQDVPDIEKSLREYLNELRDKDTGLYKQINEVVAETVDWTGKSATITTTLKPLYDQLEHEAQTQARIRSEMEYLQPHWAQALEQAEVYAERKARLELSYERLKENLTNKAKQ